MKNLNWSTFRKYYRGPKVLLLLVVLIGLGGAWKMVQALAAAAHPQGAASAPYVYLVKDINAGGARHWGGSAVAGDTLYFGTSSLYPNGNALWKSDGTPGGTVKVKSESVTSDYTAAGEGLFYAGWDQVTKDTMLSYSDGTPAGTTELARWHEGDCYPDDLVFVNQRLFFVCETFDDYRLWASDSTVTGTAQLAIFTYLHDLVPLGNTLYFAASETSYQTQLWKSDGTPGGTVVVKDINLGSSDDSVADLKNINGTLFLGAYNGVDAFGLWKSDGTEDGSTLVKGFPKPTYEASPFSMTDVNGAIFFSIEGSPSSLWKSDGSETGTVKVKEISYIESGTDLTNLNGLLFFTADDGVNGEELWRSDGSEAGTAMVKDIYPGSETSNPWKLLAQGGALYFVAMDPIYGEELWISNGTPDGTFPIKDINPGAGSTRVNGLAEFGGRLWFFAEPSGSLGLWQSYGTQASTTQVKLISSATVPASPTGMYEFKGQAYFAAGDGTHGYELWKSDGSAAGTVLVADIFPGSDSGLTIPYSEQVDFDPVQSVGDTLFFMANDGEHGHELWKTDGTTNGTVLVKDIFPGPYGGIYNHFTEFNGELFFAGEPGYRGLWKSDGTLTGTVSIQEFPDSWGMGSLLPISDTLFFVPSSEDPELWKTDGTVTGTQLVKGGFSYNANETMPGQLTEVDGTLFFAADDGVNGVELWKSDGTLTGTVMVKNTVPGSADSVVEGLLNVNGTLFFQSGIDGSRSLWKSDGTDPGTVKIKDIPDMMDYCIVYQGKYFFGANDGLHGYELWQSDGTEGGTFMVKDLNPAGNSSPWSFNVLDGILIFTAQDEAGGRELWRSDGTEQGTVLLADIYPGPDSSGLMFFVNAAGLLMFSADNGDSGAELFAVNSGVGLQPVFLPLLRR